MSADLLVTGYAFSSPCSSHPWSAKRADFADKFAGDSYWWLNDKREPSLPMFQYTHYQAQLIVGYSPTPGRDPSDTVRVSTAFGGGWSDLSPASKGRQSYLAATGVRSCVKSNEPIRLTILLNDTVYEIAFDHWDGGYRKLIFRPRICTEI